MKVEKEKVVAVSYELEVEGAIADKAGSEAPLEYIHGTGMLLPKFEAALEGKEPGAPFEFTLSPKEGYGEYDPGYIARLPMEAFQIDGKTATEFLQVGRTLPMLNSEGQVVRGVIIEVGADFVSMDFNHPMAGKTLHFTGKIEAVRDATDKELKEGLHGEYLPPEGGCGGCHGGCKNGECKDGGCKNGECKDGGCGDCDCGCGE